MKVICQNNKGWERLPLTIGKMYHVIESVPTIPHSPSRIDDPSGPFYKMECDGGEIRHFEAWRFRELTPCEKREIKLNELYGFNLDN